MHTTTHFGLCLFLGLVLGGVLGRIVLGQPTAGALTGALAGLALAWFLDRRTGG